MGRRLQVLHEHDACCFGAGSRPEAHPPIVGTRHAQILAYNRAVQAESKGWMCTAVTTGAPRPICLRLICLRLTLLLCPACV